MSDDIKQEGTEVKQAEVKVEVVQNTEVTQPVAEQKKEAKPESRIDALKKAVDDKVKQQAPTDIFSSLLDMMYEEKRKVLQSLVLEGMKKRDEVAEKLKKESANPDQETFDSEGNSVNKFFSKSKAENIKKFKKELQEISDGLEKFLAKGDSSQLEKVLKNQQNNQGKPENKDQSQAK